MPSFFFLRLLLFVLTIAGLTTNVQAETKPNILIILADDK